MIILHDGKSNQMVAYSSSVKLQLQQEILFFSPVMFPDKNFHVPI